MKAAESRKIVLVNFIIDFKDIHVWLRVLSLNLKFSMPTKLWWSSWFFRPKFEELHYNSVGIEIQAEHSQSNVYIFAKKWKMLAKKIIYHGVKHTPLQLRAWFAATNLRSYDFMIVSDCLGSCISFFLANSKLFAALLSKNGSGAYVVPAGLGNSVSIWKIHSLIICQFLSLVDWPARESCVSTSISWILKIGCSRIMAWAPIFFQPWMLARHAAPKSQYQRCLLW